jgi:hypothetical protein
LKSAAIPDASCFQSCIRRIRAGEARAAEEFLRRYESVIRRQVLYVLTDARLGRLFESVDICQTVLASFFFRAALGQDDLDNPESLLKLLLTMTRRKVAQRAPARSSSSAQFAASIQWPVPATPRRDSLPTRSVSGFGRNLTAGGKNS